MTKKFRFMVRLLAVVLAVVMLQVCENLLKSIGLAGAAAAISAAFTYTVCRAILPRAEMNGTLTLVALKVKLSN